MRVRKNKQCFLFLLLSVLLLLSSCKTTRQVNEIALISKSKNIRIESIINQSIHYNTFSSSLKFNIEPGLKRKNISVDGQIRIIKDKTIQLSLRVPILNTEAARISITPEQIVVIDRLNKQFLAESIEKMKLLTSFDFDFYSLQALFTNRLFIAGKNSILPDDYDAFNMQEEEFYARLNHRDAQKVSYDFESDYTDKILKTKIYKGDTNMTWNYLDFGLTDNRRLFPMKMYMELIVPNDLISMDLSFSKVVIDKEFELDTTIPKKYKQVTIDQLIKAIQSSQ
jgi:hypothetical protein